MSLKAYQKAAIQAEAPRDTEYRVFARVTHALLEIAGQANPSPADLVGALDLNRRLWSTLALDCSDPGNQLPEALRAQIISLSIWVSKHSSLVATREGSIRDLIELNRTIMQGLAPGAGGGAAESDGFQGSR